MYSKKIKNNKNLAQNGYQMIVVPRKILSILKQDIKNNLLKKFKLISAVYQKTT